MYFRNTQPGFLPWLLTAEKAALLIQALQNLAMALTYLIEGELQVDFENGETLYRFYAPEKELWLNRAEKLRRPDVRSRLQVTDEVLIARLKKQKKTTARLEIDAPYLPLPVQEEKDARPFFAAHGTVYEPHQRPGSCAGNAGFER